MNRRQFLTTLGATAAATTAPAMIDWRPTLGSSDTLTAFALSSDAEMDRFGSEGHPSFVVSYDDADGRADLREWVTSHDDGRVLREYENLNQLAVSVPWDVAGRQSYLGVLERHDGGFDDLEYVGFADANAELSLPEPINDLDSESEFDVSMRVRDRVSMMVSLGSRTIDPDTEGLAFDGDAPEATLREARRLVGAPDSVIEGAGTDVTVCVIDTGVNDASQYDDAEGERRISDESALLVNGDHTTVAEEGTDVVEAGDDSEHGDWVSSCILANNDDGRFTGFAPSAELVAAKSLNDDGGGKVADIIAGVDLAIDVGADVICMSLGSPQWSEALADALEQAWDQGAVPVVATGNDRYATTFVAAPASAVSSEETDTNGLAVNACNVPESGDRDDTLVSYFGNIAPSPGTQDLSGGASEGAGPHLLAPGMNVRIDPVGTLTGTSMAAPMVAGAAAVLAGEGYDNEQILERLTAHAYPAPNFGVTEAGAGLLDLGAALAGTEPDEVLEDVQTDAAKARDDINRALSDTRGRRLAGFL